MKVVWLATAKRDLRRIQTYFEAVGAPESGFHAVRRILEKSLILGSFPFLGPVEESSTKAASKYRKIIAEKYIIYYTVQDDQVVIAAVTDGRKDPQDLGNRLK
jgi:plasmid stabilization system protein ParE